MNIPDEAIRAFDAATFRREGRIKGLEAAAPVIIKNTLSVLLVEAEKLREDEKYTDETSADGRVWNAAVDHFADSLVELLRQTQEGK